MMNTIRRLALLVLPLVCLACGETGSEPELYSEVQFRVSQDGGGTFSLRSLSAGGQRRRISPDAVYSTIGPVRFLVEGAPGPYSAEFCRRSGGDMAVAFTADSTNLPGQVRLNFETAGIAGHCVATSALCGPTSTGAACLRDADCSSGEACEKRLSIVFPQGSVDVDALPEADPDVRFETCVPIGTQPCTVAGDPPTTVYGRVVGGSVGDIASTYLVSDETPSVYFLFGARAGVNGIFRAAGDEVVQVQLYVDNRLRATESGNRDVVIRRDL